MCIVVLSQTWHEHFFVLSPTHLFYTEEQQQDVIDDDAADDEVDSDCRLQLHVDAVFSELCFRFVFSSLGLSFGHVYGHLVCRSIPLRSLVKLSLGYIDGSRPNLS